MTSDVAAYGLYPWFEEDGESCVHPDDLASFRALLPYGKVFKLLGEEEKPYLRLGYGSRSWRVVPKLFKQVVFEGPDIGDSVMVKASKKAGQIVEVHWHHKRGEAFFELSFQGKVASRRYWRDEFERLIVDQLVGTSEIVSYHKKGRTNAEES